jgi:L-alanine-DL-glutamate epimerase-like enolase superfamily enzyme
MSTIRDIRFRRTVRPMRTTFATALGSKTAATSVLVKVTLDDGSEGVGEVPTSFVLQHETVPAIESILRETRDELIALPVEECPRRIEVFRRRFAGFHMTISGLEVAVFRATLAARGVSEHRHWGAACDRVETDITIPFIGDEGVLRRWMKRVVKIGFRVYKVKVSGDVEADIRFLRRVRAMLEDAMPAPPRGVPFVVRLDGNQGYNRKTYLRMIDRLAKERLAVELFEQPLPKDDHEGLRIITKRSGLPIVLDETVFCRDDCRRAIDQGLGHGVNIKVAKSGIAESAGIMEAAKEAGMKLMIGCMTETMVALSAGILMAGGTGAFDYVDLDSIHFLHHRKVCGDIRVEGPRYVIHD